MQRGLILTLSITAFLFHDLASGASAAFEVRTRSERPPESPEIFCCDVNLGDAQFTFIVPNGWQLRPDRATRKLLLSSTNQLEMAYMEVAFSPDKQPLNSKTATNAFQTTLTTLFPKAKITAPFLLYGGSLPALAFDVSWSSGKIQEASRYAFMPHSNGVVQISLTSSPSNFAKYQSAFSVFLTSFSLTSDLVAARPEK